MGLDASVMCTCYAEGNIKAPPFSKDPLYIDEDGYLSLNLPWEGHEEKHLQFEKWRENACLHANMCQVKVHLSNWGGYRLFQETLAEAGWEHFPMLHSELPNANGGQMSSTNAQIALSKLDYFIRDWQGREVVCLFDSDTGELLLQQRE